MKKRNILVLVIAFLSIFGIQTIVSAATLGPLMKANEKYFAGLGSTHTVVMTCNIKANNQGQEFSMDMNIVIAIKGENFATDMTCPQMPVANSKVILSGKNCYMFFTERKEYAQFILDDEQYARLKQSMQTRTGNNFAGEYLGSGTEMYGGSMMNYEDYEILDPKENKKFYARYYFGKDQRIRFMVADMGEGVGSFEIVDVRQMVDAEMFKLPTGYTKIDMDSQLLENMF